MKKMADSASEDYEVVDWPASTTRKRQERKMTNRMERAERKCTKSEQMERVFTECGIDPETLLPEEREEMFKALVQSKEENQKKQNVQGMYEAQQKLTDGDDNGKNKNTAGMKLRVQTQPYTSPKQVGKVEEKRKTRNTENVVSGDDIDEDVVVKHKSEDKRGKRKKCKNMTDTDFDEKTHVGEDSSAGEGSNTRKGRGAKKSGEKIPPKCKKTIQSGSDSMSVDSTQNLIPENDHSVDVDVTEKQVVEDSDATLDPTSDGGLKLEMANTMEMGGNDSSDEDNEEFCQERKRVLQEHLANLLKKKSSKKAKGKPVKQRPDIFSSKAMDVLDLTCDDTEEDTTPEKEDSVSRVEESDDSQSECVSVKDISVQASLGTSPSSCPDSQGNSLASASDARDNKKSKSLANLKSSAIDSSGSETLDEDTFGNSQENVRTTGFLSKKHLSLTGSCDNADVSSPDMLSQGQRTLRLHTQPSLSNTGNDNMDKSSEETRKRKNSDSDEGSKKKICLIFDLFDPFPTENGEDLPVPSGHPLIAKREIHKKKKDLKPYFAPPGCCYDEYAKRILQFVEDYHHLLRQKQQLSSVNIPWGMPILQGPHQKGTLDKKTREMEEHAPKSADVVVVRRLMSQRKAAQAADIRLQETTGHQRQIKSRLPLHPLDEENRMSDSDDFSLFSEIKKGVQARKQVGKNTRQGRVHQELYDAETQEYDIPDIPSTQFYAKSHSIVKKARASPDVQAKKTFCEVPLPLPAPTGYTIPRMQIDSESDEDFNPFLDNIPQTKRKRELCRKNLGRKGKTRPESGMQQACKKRKKKATEKDFDEEEPANLSSPVFIPKKLLSSMKRVVESPSSPEKPDSLSLLKTADRLDSDASSDPRLHIPLLERTTNLLYKKHSNELQHSEGSLMESSQGETDSVNRGEEDTTGRHSPDILDTIENKPLSDLSGNSDHRASSGEAKAKKRRKANTQGLAQSSDYSKNYAKTSVRRGDAKCVSTESDGEGGLEDSDSGGSKAKTESVGNSKTNTDTAGSEESTQASHTRKTRQKLKRRVRGDVPVGLQDSSDRSVEKGQIIHHQDSLIIKNYVSDESDGEEEINEPKNKAAKHVQGKGKKRLVPDSVEVLDDKEKKNEHRVTELDSDSETEEELWKTGKSTKKCDTRSMKEMKQRINNNDDQFVFNDDQEILPTVLGREREPTRRAGRNPRAVPNEGPATSVSTATRVTRHLPPATVTVPPEQVRQHREQASVSGPQIQCPMCFKKFAEADIEDHAAGCQGNTEEDTDGTVVEEHGVQDKTGGVLGRVDGRQGIGPGNHTPVKMGVCPICNDRIQSAILEEHVNECLERSMQQEEDIPRRTRRHGGNDNTIAGDAEARFSPPRQQRLKPDSSTSPHQQDPSEMSDQTSESSEGEEQEENTQVTATLPFTRVSQLAHFPIDFKNQFKKSKPGSSKGTKKGVKRKRGSGKTKKKRRKK